MKIAYFYASSPDIYQPEITTLPPLPAIISFRSSVFPTTVDLALNIGMIGLEDAQNYSIDVNIFCDGDQVQSFKEVYEPFRSAHQATVDGYIASRHSFIDSFLSSKPGVYTFIARLYEGGLPVKKDDSRQFIHQAECSVIIAAEWR